MDRSLGRLGFGMRVNRPTTIRTWMLRVAGTMATLAVSATAAVAQDPRSPQRVPVTVAVASEELNGEPYRLLLRAVDGPRDLILLSPPANADDFFDAIGDLLAVRRVQGDTAPSTGLVRIRHTQPARPHPRRYPWAGSVFSDLRAAP